MSERVIPAEIERKLNKIVKEEVTSLKESGVIS